jgi:hypothetical protein
VNPLPRIGGYLAYLEAATFIFGFALFATLLTDYTTGDPTPAESLAFAVDNLAALLIWNGVILLLFGVVLVPLVLAVSDFLADDAAPLARVAAAFGLIWAGLVLAAGMITNVGLLALDDLNKSDSLAAERLWSALDTVENGLGGGNELVGGIWVVAVSWMFMNSDKASRAFAYLGLVSGAAGIITIVPGLEIVGAVFGLGLIVWFVWLGRVLTRSAEKVVPESRVAAAKA